MLVVVIKVSLDCIIIELVAFIMISLFYSLMIGL